MDKKPASGRVRIAFAETVPALKVALYCSPGHVPGKGSHAITLDDAKELRKQGRLDVPVRCALWDCQKLLWSVREFGQW